VKKGFFEDPGVTMELVAVSGVGYGSSNFFFGLSLCSSSPVLILSPNLGGLTMTFVPLL
jgi:hypothetical protein